MSQMLKSSGAMAAATMASRVLGLVRETVYAGFMGLKPEAAAFNLAWTIPNLFRRLLGEGALTAAFIPIFKEHEKTQGEEAMWRSGNAVISALAVISFVITAVAMAGIMLALSVYPFAENTRLMLRLLCVMFPYMPLICLAAVFMGILNSRGRFFIPALGAAVMNVVMIAAVWFIAPRLGAKLETQIFGLAIGALIAGLAQAAFQLPHLFQEGFHYRWVTPWRDETVRAVVIKMLPASVGVAATQLNVVVTQSMAFGAYAPYVVMFSVATRLMELPQGVFGVSLATYLLPTLSGLAAEKKYDEFRATLRHGVTYLIFINSLAMVLLLALAEPIIRLLFQHGLFTAEDTVAVSKVLIFLAPGLIAFSLVNILGRAFYALGDVKTPMRISLFCLVLNTLLVAMFLYVFDLGARGMGLANAISSWLNASLLFYALRRKLKTLQMGQEIPMMGRVALCALGSGGVAGVTAYFWTRHLGHASFVWKLGEVFVPMTVAAGFYYGAAIVLKIPAAGEVADLLRKRLGGRKRG